MPGVWLVFFALPRFVGESRALSRLEARILSSFEQCLSIRDCLRGHFLGWDSVPPETTSSNASATSVVTRERSNISSRILAILDREATSTPSRRNSDRVRRLPGRRQYSLGFRGRRRRHLKECGESGLRVARFLGAAIGAPCWGGQVRSQRSVEHSSNDRYSRTSPKDVLEIPIAIFHIDISTC